jgi:hypothetical protein
VPVAATGADGLPAAAKVERSIKRVALDVTRDENVTRRAQFVERARKKS